MLCIYSIFKTGCLGGLFAIPFISWLSSTYLFQTFDSKEAYVKALLEAQDRKMQAELLPMLQKTGKLTIEQAIRWFRDSFRTENNILMELTLDDWGAQIPSDKGWTFQCSAR